MELDGIFRQIQILSDGLVGAPVAQLPQHRQLARAESVLVRDRCPPQAAEHLRDQFALRAGEHQFAIASLRDVQHALKPPALFEKNAYRTLGGDKLQQILQAGEGFFVCAAQLENQDAERIQPARG